MNSVVSFVVLFDDLLVPKNTTAVLEAIPNGYGRLFRLVVNGQKSVSFNRPVPADLEELPATIEVTLEYSHENIAIASVYVGRECYEESFYIDSFPGLRFNDWGEDSESISLSEVESEASDGVSAFA